MKKLFVFLALATTAYLLSCTTDAKPAKPLNPNGDSELALLMRDMFDDGMKVKEQIQRGEKPDISVAFEKIHTADATEPEKAASAEYHAFALSYVQAVKALKEAQPGETEATYTNMVHTCMNCHKALCPGPAVRIKKMYL